MKSHRDGRPEAAHLDAAESLPYALETLFALHRRVRPYNKYLRWELEHHPLGDPRWDAGRLLPVLRRILADGDPGTQRALFTRLLELQLVNRNDLVILTKGELSGVQGGTNSMQILKVALDP